MLLSLKCTPHFLYWDLVHLTGIYLRAGHLGCLGERARPRISPTLKMENYNLSASLRLMSVFNKEEGVLYRETVLSPVIVNVSNCCIQIMHFSALRNSHRVHLSHSIILLCTGGKPLGLSQSLMHLFHLQLYSFCCVFLYPNMCMTQLNGDFIHASDA